MPGAELADPLCIIEQPGEPDRPLAPMFIPCGTKDPLLEDSRRLARALDTRGVANDLQIYPGGVHAFHAFAFREEARQCWRDHRAFFERWVSGPG
jgi:acetyl esterase